MPDKLKDNLGLSPIKAPPINAAGTSADSGTGAVDPAGTSPPTTDAPATSDGITDATITEALEEANDDNDDDFNVSDHVMESKDESLIEEKMDSANVLKDTLSVLNKKEQDVVSGEGERERERERKLP